MQSSQYITQVMRELGLDPNDSDQRAIIEHLIAGKPNAVVDQQFISELRNQLAEYSKSSKFKQKSNQSTSPLNFMKKGFVFAFIIVLVVAAGGFWFMQQGQTPLINIGTNLGNDTELLSGKYAVTEVSANSFGELKTANLSAPGRGGDAAQKANTTNTATTEDSQKMIAPGEPNGGGETMPYPGGEVYRFKYNGRDLTGLNDSEPVYKRLKPNQSEGIVSRIISTISLGLVDLTRLRSGVLQNFSIVENRDYGYGFNVAVDYGSVSIYQNWEKWPNPINDCKDEKCFAQYRVKESDMPSNEEAITIADNFMTEYSISREGYGQPVVQDDFRRWYLQTPATDRVNFYWPESVQVTYPMIINQETVYDESGNLYGLNVQVDVRTRRVSNVYEIVTKQFEKSNYAAETSAGRIIGVAERGGFRNYPYEAPGAKIVTLELGTPTREIINLWYSRDNNRTSESVYVPALVFPITNANSTNYWRKNVIVPLVKEMLDSDDNQGQPIPLDLPTTSEPAMGASGASPRETQIAPAPSPTAR